MHVAVHVSVIAVTTHTLANHTNEGRVCVYCTCLCTFCLFFSRVLALSLTHTHTYNKSQAGRAQQKAQSLVCVPLEPSALGTRHQSCHMKVHIHEPVYPPIPINYVCSLSGCQISANYHTYRSGQIFKSCAEDQRLQDVILRTRLCGTGFITLNC